MHNLRMILAMLLLLSIAYGSEVEPNKLHIVLNHKDGPLNGEWIVETTNVGVDVFTAILKDVGGEISWDWSRLKKSEDSFYLIGKLAIRDESSIIGVVYNLKKVDGKWTMESNQKKIIISK